MNRPAHLVQYVRRLCLAAVVGCSWLLVSPRVAAADPGEAAADGGAPLPSGGPAAPPARSPAVGGGTDAPDQPDVGATGPLGAEPIPALPDKSLSPPPPPASPAEPPPDTPYDYLHRDPAHYKKIDQLREPGLTTTFPPTIDTLLEDLGGWRSAMADVNLGLEMRSASGVLGQFNSTGGPAPTSATLAYEGQRFTLSTQSSSATFTYRLNALGLPDTKIVAGMTYSVNNAQTISGPNLVTFSGLYLYQSVADRTLEIKFGFLGNQNEFVGFFIGGSPVLSSGLAGIIPLEAGLINSHPPRPSRSRRARRPACTSRRRSCARPPPRAHRTRRCMITPLACAFPKPAPAPCGSVSSASASKRRRRNTPSGRARGASSTTRTTPTTPPAELPATRRCTAISITS